MDDKVLGSVTIAVVELLKRSTRIAWVSGKTAPLFSAVVFGLLNSLFNSATFTWPSLLDNFQGGFLKGLMATGVYAVVKLALTQTAAPVTPAIPAAPVTPDAPVPPAT